MNKKTLLISKILYKLQYIDPSAANWKGGTDIEKGFYLVKRQWVWWLGLIPAVTLLILKQAIIILLEYIIELNNFKCHSIDVKDGVDPKTIDKKTLDIIRINLAK